MPFARPTLNEIIDRLVTDVASRLPGTGTTLLRRSLAGVLARSEAGAAHSLYGYLDFISRQAIPDTAEDEYLLRWAAIWLPDGRKPATFASGTDALQVTGAVGSFMPSGTLFVRSDQVVFRTTEDLTLASGTGTVSVTAQLAGVAGNTVAGISLQLQQPVTGFVSTAVVVSPGIAGGVDEESLAALQARLIKRIQQPPQGGSVADYETWALAVPGVTKVWVAPLELGPGTVTVRVGNDDVAGNYIPSPAVVAAAQAYINERRPVTAQVTVLAPIADPRPHSIALTPNTAATQSAVLAELRDMYEREAEPGGIILLSKVREAVSVANGVLNSAVTVPAADYDAPTGYLPTVGAITWSTL